MKKKLLMMLFCAMMAFSLVACGGENDNGDNRKDESEETEIEEVEAPWKDAYKEVLAGVLSEEGEYAFDQEEYGKLEDYAQYLEDEHEYNPGYVYELRDVNADGTPELFVKFNRLPDAYKPIYVFTYDGDSVKKFEQVFYEEIAADIRFSTKYMGILSLSASRWTGETYFSVYEIVDGKIEKVLSVSYTYDQTEDPKYSETWERIEWTDASDLSLIENYENDNVEKESIVSDENE